MTSLGIILSKLWSLSMDAYPFDKLPPDKCVSLWRLNPDKFNRLIAERQAGVKVIDLGCSPRITQNLVRAAVGQENYLGIDSNIKKRFLQVQYSLEGQTRLKPPRSLIIHLLDGCKPQSLTTGVCHDLTCAGHSLPALPKTRVRRHLLTR
jgi:hypothetical protein